MSSRIGVDITAEDRERTLSTRLQQAERAHEFTKRELESVVLQKHRVEQQVAALQRERKEADEGWQRAENELAMEGFHRQVVVDRAEAAERDVLALREYAQHKDTCHLRRCEGTHAIWAMSKHHCTCGLSSLLTDRSEEKLAKKP